MKRLGTLQLNFLQILGLKAGQLTYHNQDITRMYKNNIYVEVSTQESRHYRNVLKQSHHHYVFLFIYYSMAVVNVVVVTILLLLLSEKLRHLFKMETTIFPSSRT